MNYSSTRDNKKTVTSMDAVLNGIAEDGGLYICKNLKDNSFDYKNLIGKDIYSIAEDVLCFLLSDYPREAMRELVEKAYDNKFDNKELTPLVKVKDDYILELFHGPTSAFKDVALCMLPQLIQYARKTKGMTEKIVILTATSGDTGKAALEGFKDVEGIKIIVFYPDNGVSQIQRQQMITQEGNNVCVCAIKGNFDDAQTGVKNIFNDVSKNHILDDREVILSSANSINIGRLAPQVVYYFKAYSDLVTGGEIKLGDSVNFVVPTGNFGDILAGYFAKCMGLPIGRLICASNRNDVLTDFVHTGVYNRNREFYKTSSPSMDILVSSNLERLLYLLSDGDDMLISEYMNELNTTGKYTVNEKIKSAIDKEFFAGCCDDEATSQTIKRVYEDYGYLLDTHTAVAYNVMEQFKSQNDNGFKTVVLSTASPYKFSSSVLKSLGYDDSGSEFEVMHKLHKITGVSIPGNLSHLEDKKVLHTDVIEKQNMLQYVLERVETNE